MKTFQLSDRQEKQLNEWLDTVIYPAFIEKQRQEMDPAEFYDLTMNGSYPYLGAIGGGVEFSFTPNSIGVGVEARFIPTGETIDLTEYDLW